MSSRLSPATRKVLADHKPLAPFFSNAIEAELFEAKWQRGPFKVLPYAGPEGRYIVFDTRAALARGVVGTPLPTIQAAARALVDAWTAAGKPKK